MLHRRRHTSLAGVIRFAKRRAPVIAVRAVVHTLAPSVAFDAVTQHTALTVDRIVHTAADTAAIHVLSSLAKILVHV
jgi:hypothetical protein